MTGSKRGAVLVKVRSLSRQSNHGIVMAGQLRFPCALGRSGIRAIKREGDGATPVGRWRVQRIYFRRDRLMRFRTSDRMSSLRPTDGWCDAPTDPNYNRRVGMPYAASAEEMYRSDHLYDIVVTLNHNVCPRVRNGGSAIFVHLARPGYQPTAGCVALELKHLRTLLSSVSKHVAIDIR